MSELPQGWALTTIAELGGLVGGKTPSKATELFWADGAVPWVSPKDMKRSVLVSSEDLISDAAVEKAGMHLLPPASVLMVTRSGILSHTFPVALTAMPCTINQDIKALRPNAALDPRYCAHLLRSLGPTIIGECSKAGTTVASINTESLEQLTLPMAPLAEQQRIADKLDTLLSRIDACRDRLDRVGPLLQRFRQSVLSSATSGELDSSQDEWPVVRLGDVAGDFSYGSATKSSPTGQVPVLRMGNLQRGKLDWNDLVFTSNADEVDRYRLERGDVLFNRTNSPELVGKTAVYKGERPAIYAGYLIRIRCSRVLHPEFLHYCLSAPAGRDYCRRVKSDGVSQSNINATKLRDFTLSLPPIDVQKRIVDRVETLLSLSDHIEARCIGAVRGAKRLTQATLAKAFRGELVPQDPNDEPASALLARLRQPAAAADPARRRRRAPVP